MSTSDMQSRSSRPCGFESGYHFHGVNKRVVVKRNADVNPQKTSNMARAFCRLATFPAISKAFPTIERGGDLTYKDQSRSIPQFYLQDGGVY
jgi:hypothetical protein